MHAGAGHPKLPRDLRLLQPTGREQTPRSLAASFESVEIPSGTEYLAHGRKAIPTHRQARSKSLLYYTRINKDPDGNSVRFVREAAG